MKGFKEFSGSNKVIMANGDIVSGLPFPISEVNFGLNFSSDNKSTEMEDDEECSPRKCKGCIHQGLCDEEDSFDDDEDY